MANLDIDLIWFDDINYLYYEKLQCNIYQPEGIHAAMGLVSIPLDASPRATSGAIAISWDSWAFYLDFVKNLQAAQFEMVEKGSVVNIGR